MTRLDSAQLIQLLEMENDPLGREVVQLSQRLADHVVYHSLKTLDDIRIFMRFHVWCVWDFMSLAKSIQLNLGCFAFPWYPPADATLVHLINTIVTTEEADPESPGGCASHFETYLEAMVELGADTGTIHSFIDLLRHDSGVEWALQQCQAPPESAAFVRETMRVASGSLPGAVASFCLGREEIVPRMFTTLVEALADTETEHCPKFWWYLNRHVQIDRKCHGPASTELFHRVVGMKPTRVREAALSDARSALQARHNLLDATLAALHRTGTSQRVPRPGSRDAAWTEVQEASERSRRV